MYHISIFRTEGVGMMGIRDCPTLLHVPTAAACSSIILFIRPSPRLQILLNLIVARRYHWRKSLFVQSSRMPLKLAQTWNPIMPSSFYCHGKTLVMISNDLTHSIAPDMRRLPRRWAFTIYLKGSRLTSWNSFGSRMRCGIIRSIDLIRQVCLGVIERLAAGFPPIQAWIYIDESCVSAFLSRHFFFRTPPINGATYQSLFDGRWHIFPHVAVTTK